MGDIPEPVSQPDLTYAEMQTDHVGDIPQPYTAPDQSAVEMQTDAIEPEESKAIDQSST